jgi:hypothetical protein
MLVDDRHQLQVGLGHRPAGLANGRVLAADGELLLHHVGGAQHHVGQVARLGGTAALQQPARLGVEVAQPHGNVLVVRIEAALELRVADRRRDGIGVGTAVSGDVDGAHTAIIAGAIPSRPKVAGGPT